MFKQGNSFTSGLGDSYNPKILIIIIMIINSLLFEIGVLNRTNTKEFKDLEKEVLENFTISQFEDKETGKTVKYNLYFPVNYSASKKYPLITFIGDASTVGEDVRLPLRAGIGALIWGSKYEQNKHESFVLVPQYPEVILDDHGKYTVTEYVDLTKRLIEYIEESYSIDKKRIYGTGQSMGCMTTLILSSKYPTLYTASLFISGQWNVTELKNLYSQKFIYLVASGDDRASAGQKEVKDMFNEDKVPFNNIENVNAKASKEELFKLINEFLSKGFNYNFITFKKGTTLPEYVAHTFGEHMFSFDYGYRLEACRDWLFNQTK